ncbi:MAG: histidine kinase [Bdellovibrionaceae bacterium]|nr:histidine kinase [Pseudobdellovibrionaceae bacterium]
MYFLLIPIFFLFSKEGSRQSGKLLGEGKEKASIELSEPKGGWTVEQMVTIEGSVSDRSVDPILVNINGTRYLLRTFSGKFKRKFPLSSGKNTIVVQATNKGGTSKVERSVLAKAPPTPIMVILTSDTDGVYTDLHIYEPKANLAHPMVDSANEQEHVFWAQVASPSGGKFYLNSQGDDFDQPGYGPYLYTHKAPPIGIYRIDSNYWPSGDKAHTVGTLNVTLNGGKPNELNRMIKAPLAKPGETVTMAWIRIDKGGKAYLYAPGLDPVPKDYSIWPEWVIKYKAKEKNGTDSYEI